MKYQFQFAGADLRRPSSSNRKRLRLGMLAAGCVLAALSYSYYLFHLTHHRTLTKARAAAAVAVVSSAKPAQAGELPAKLPPALERAANASVTTIGTFIVGAVQVPQPVLPAAPCVPAPPQAVPVANPVSTGFKIVSSPTVKRPTRVLTAEQKMARAAQTALDRMLGQANKYPDAYGFLPEDNFAVVKLGNAIPVYSVAEKDRADYKSGQPVKAILQPTKQWMYPVLAGDRVCCMVRVSFNGHDYIPGESSKSLAMAWAKITEKWPEAEGFHPQLVVNQDIPGFFFTIPELPTPNLTDTDQMSGFHPNLSPADVILASWR
jgi:hypothetical protein